MKVVMLSLVQRTLCERRSIRNESATTLTATSGVSVRDATLLVPGMESGEGGASINEDVLKVNKTENLPTVKVQVIDIEAEIERVLSSEANARLLLKIDCEGEEYQIFEKLENAHFLDRVAGFIIEWHIKGPQPILDFLKRKN